MSFFKAKNCFLLLALSLLISCTCSQKKESELEPSFRVSLDHKIQSLDPHRAEDPESLKLVSLIFDSLLQFDYQKRPYEIVPSLAKEFPRISADQLTLTFKLNRDKKFGNGQPLTVEDVLFSLKRMVDPNFSSRSSWIFEGKVVGLAEWQSQQKETGETDYSQEIAGFKKVDEETFEIRLLQKYPQLLQLLAMPQTSIVSQKLLSGVNDLGTKAELLVGTGPYEIRSSKEGQEFQVVVKNGPKSKAAETVGAEKPRSVVVTQFPNDRDRWVAFQNNRLDLIKVPLEVVQEVIDQETFELSQNYQAKNYQVHHATQLETEYLAFNLKDPFIKKAGPKFRRAIALALDKKDIIKRFYNGSAVLAHSPVPPNLFGYEESYQSEHTEFDIKKAKKLLAEAGYPGGKGVPTLKHEYLSNKFVHQNAEYFKTAMSKLGIKVELVHNTEAEFFAKIRNSEAQIWRISWIYDYPDAENFLQVFYGPNREEGGPNSANYRNSEYDKSYEAMRGLFDVPQKMKHIQKMKEILSADLPWIPLLHKVDFFLSHEQVENFFPGYLGGSSARWVKLKKISENSEN